MLRLLLDYDGTLHDCLRVYAPAFQRVYEKLVEAGRRPPRRWQPEELKRWLGVTPKKMWETFAPDLPPAVREWCSREILREMLRRTAEGEAQLYPGIPAVLEEWRARGYSLILLSSCQRAYLEAHSRAFALERSFDGLFCAEDYGWLPKWKLFPAIAREFPGEYVVIGDRASDMEVARRHRLHSLGCAYGYGGLGELDGATLQVAQPEELSQALEVLRCTRFSQR